MAFRHVGEGICEQIPKVKYDRVTGLQFERKWEGRADLVRDNFFALIQGSQQADFSADGCKATVNTRYGNAAFDGSQEVDTVSFSLRCEEFQQSIFKHPRFSGIPIDLVKLIQTEHAGSTSYSASVKAIKALTAALDQPDEPSLEAFALLIGADENYLVAQTYVVTMTRTSSFGFLLGLVFANDGKLFTTSQLANYLGSTLPWAIPAFNNFSTSEALRYVYGWRKRGSEVTILPNNNKQLQEQWQSARWSLLLYDPAT